MKLQHYFSLVKFEHTIFALPFALIGFFIALSQGYVFSYKTLTLVILCMVFARNGSMAFNRYLDRNIDGMNSRTKNREIPSGKLGVRAVLVFTITNSLLFIACSWLLNPLCGMLSPFVLVVLLGYSFVKRFSPLCHFILGIGLGMSPIAAYIAVTGSITILPFWFGLAVFFWVSGFDIIYAMQDTEFDKQYKLHSVPQLLGNLGALWCSRVLHLLTASIVIYIGLFFEVGRVYHVGSFVFIASLLNQHLLVKPHNLSRVNLAFFTSNGIASIVFGLFTIISLP